MGEPNRKDSLVEVLIWTVVVLVALGILTVVVPPYFRRSHATSSINVCVNNLRQIDAAANEYALEHHLSLGTPIHFPNDLTPYIKLNSAGQIPSCPSGGKYKIAHVGDTPTCSLSNTVVPAHVLP